MSIGVPPIFIWANAKCEKAETAEDPIINEKLKLFMPILESFNKDLQISPEAEYEILSKLIKFAIERQEKIWGECMDASYEEMPMYPFEERLNKI